MNNFMREFKQVPVTVGLSVLMAVIYLGEVLRSGGLTIGIRTLYDFGGLMPAGVYLNDEWWRLITAGFVHASFTHIILNGIVIYFIGRILETTLGSIQVATIFILGVVGGNLFSMMFGPLMTVNIGASSGAFALVGSVIYLGVVEKRRGVWMQQMQTMLIFVGMNIVFSLFDPSIGIWAHVGGFLVGMTVTGALFQSRYAQSAFKTNRTTRIVAIVLTIALLVGLFVAVTARFNNLLY